MSQEIQEPKCSRYVEEDAIEEQALPLYMSIKNFENEMILFSNKNEFKKYLKQETTVSPYSLKGLLIGDIDRDLADLFIFKYCSANNQLRREMMNIFLGFGFVDNNYIKVEHRTETIKSMTYISKKIEENTSTLTDCITIAINNNFVTCLYDLVNKIKSANDY